MKKLVPIFLILCASAWGAQVKLDTMTSFPYHVAPLDTITIDGDTTTVTTVMVPDTALFIEANDSSWLVDFHNQEGTDPDTLIFDTSGISTSVGILIYGNYSTKGMIKGGVIKHGSVTAADVIALKMQNMTNMTVRDVEFRVQGEAASAIESAEHDGGGYNILICNCRFYIESDNFSRFAKEVCAVKMGDFKEADTTYGDFAYHLKIDSCYATGPHMLIYVGGWLGEASAQIMTCSLIVDGYNSAGSWANCYAIGLENCGGAQSYPTIIRDNVIRSGSSYGGGRGIIVEYSHAPYANRAKIVNNDIDVHQGYDGEGDGVQALRIRWGVKNWEIDSNIIIARGDGNGVGTDGYGDNVYTVRIQTAQEDSENPDSTLVRCDSIYFRYNTVKALNTTTNDLSNCYALIMEHESTQVMVSAYNRWESADAPVRMGFSNWGCQGLTLNSDTLVRADTADTGALTYIVGFNSLGGDEDSLCYYGVDNMVSDVAYLNGTDDSSSEINLIQVQGRTCTSELTYRVTLLVTVKDSTGQPIPNAACSVWDDYSHLVLAEVTDAEGQADTLAEYQYLSDISCSDSIDFNPFSFKAIYSGDSTVVDSTVASDKKSFVLTLSATGGGAEEKFVKIRGVTILGGRIQ